MEKKCPLCPFKSYELEQMKEHLDKCGIDAMEKKFECKYEHCNYASNKKANLKRHLACLLRFAFLLLKTC